MVVIFLERRTQIRVIVAFLVILTAASMRVGTLVGSDVWQARAGLAPIRSVDTGEGLLGLSFDLQEGEHTVQELLKLLKSQQLRATFFISGAWASHHPELVTFIQQGQHEVANGGFTSEKHPTLGPEAVAQSIVDTHRALKEALQGEPAALFRPPGGYSNRMVVEIALEEGYHTVLWRLDSRDRVTNNAERTIKWVTAKARPGDIIRFSADDTGHEAATIVAGVIKGLAERGLRFTSVGSLIQRAQD